MLGAISKRRADFTAARHYHEKAIQMQRAIHDRWNLVDTLLNLCTLLSHRGNYAEAQSFEEESLALY
jgi:hypothetical protein